MYSNESDKTSFSKNEEAFTESGLSRSKFSCPAQEQNKWFHLCDQCKAQATSDPAIREKCKWFATRMDEISPPLNGTDSDDAQDILKCEVCSVEFEDYTQLKSHFAADHPGYRDVKYKRGKSTSNPPRTHDDKRSRRKQSEPQKVVL